MSMSALSAHNRPIASHSECVRARGKFLDLLLSDSSMLVLHQLPVLNRNVL